MLTLLVLIPFAGGLLAWPAERLNKNAPRWIALIALLIPGLLAVFGSGADVARPWMPAWGIDFRLAIDGLSRVLLILTYVIGAAAVLASWTDIEQRVGFFHFNLLWALTGSLGIFLARDLVLFYFFWELFLLPMFLLIYLWGHENRGPAAVKFFIFTQGSGLLMLLAILGLYFYHGQATGLYTFNYAALLNADIPLPVASVFFLGFFAAFATKLPVVPLHTWFVDAIAEAPTGALLAGLLIKTGAYGLLRFALPLFPEAAHNFSLFAMMLAVVGVLYGALTAVGQTDLRRFLAYASVSHVGFVLLGIFAGNSLAHQGVLMQLVCHSLSAGALFLLVGGLRERLNTRDMELMGGFWTLAPKMGAAAVFFTLASMGLPGLGNFVAEFLILMGSFQTSPLLTALAALGLVGGTVYSLWLLQRVFQGPARSLQLSDLTAREMLLMVVLGAGLLWLGLYPQPVLNAARPALEGLLQ